MIETLTLITISVLLLIYFRPGKTEPLDNPLTINRVGQFNARLAPRLNLAQAFLVSISSYLTAHDRLDDSPQTLCFEVLDPEISSTVSGVYLLAVTLHSGVLYFHATWPQAGIAHHVTLDNFSRPTLPDGLSPHARQDSPLAAAIRRSAQQHGIRLTPL